MKKPKIYADSGWQQSWIELAALYALTAIAAAHFVPLHWLTALLAAPFLMLGLLIAVAGLVEALWLAITVLERLGTAVGLRKSPLA